MSIQAAEAVALATALSWSATYVLFSIAVHRYGAAALNRMRLLVALGLLFMLHAAVYGTPLPHASFASWGWLAASGVLGFTVSDTLLFSALQRLGAHRTSLLMALVPVFSVAIAWISLGEALSAWQAVAIGAVILGIITVLGRHSASLPEAGRPRQSPARSVRTGVLFAMGAAAAQACRYVLSKQGLSNGVPPISANVIQILCATSAAWLIAAFRPRSAWPWRATGDRKATRALLAGAFFGPFLGVTLSLIALRSAPVGIASTLMALVPVFLLPFSSTAEHKGPGIRAIAGTALAVGGAALLFLL
ncbi:DMT family transporter [Candidatus Bipolaricaulota bacterium]|nr:DMT family transporter [Candidatus Bipolaricaulota bacterium]